MTLSSYATNVVFTCQPGAPAARQVSLRAKATDGSTLALG